MTRAAIPILTSIAELAPSCDVWIVDIWGVMHNGRRAFEAAGEACRRFRAAGGLVVLLSNAPRPFTAVVDHMTSLGVDPAAYDTGVTSGDATRALIEVWAGRRLLHIGPQRDLGLFAGLGVETVPAEALPTGELAPELARKLSAPFVLDETYGTRCSTVLTISTDDELRIAERRFDARGDSSGETEHVLNAAPRG